MKEVTQRKILKVVLWEYLIGGIVNMKGLEFYEKNDQVNKIANRDKIDKSLDALGLTFKQRDEIDSLFSEYLDNTIDTIAESGLIKLKTE